MKPIRVLLGSPINVRKSYIIDEWLDYVRSLTWGALDVYLVDNSIDDKFAKQVRARGFEVDRVEPKGAPETYIAASQNKIRERFLKGNYDYLFSLECDNFCEPDVIERMLAYRVDNINVPYFLKQGEETTLGVQIAGYKDHNYKRYDVMPPEYMTTFMDGKTKQIDGMPSLGCSLFSRQLMEKVHFRFDPNQPGKFSDSFFHFDAMQVGMAPYVITSLISTHKRNAQWRKIGQVG